MSEAVFATAASAAAAVLSEMPIDCMPIIGCGAASRGENKSVERRLRDNRPSFKTVQAEVIVFDFRSVTVKGPLTPTPAHKSAPALARWGREQ